MSGWERSVLMDHELQLDPDPSGRPVLETGPWDPAFGSRFGQRLAVHQVRQMRYFVDGHA